MRTAAPAWHGVALIGMAWSVSASDTHRALVRHGAAMVAIVHDDAALGGLPVRRLDVTGFAGGHEAGGHEAGGHESATDLQQKRQVPVIDGH